MCLSSGWNASGAISGVAAACGLAGIISGSMRLLIAHGAELVVANAKVMKRVRVHRGLRSWKRTLAEARALCLHRAPSIERGEVKTWTKGRPSSSSRTRPESVDVYMA